MTTAEFLSTFIPSVRGIARRSRYLASQTIGSQHLPIPAEIHHFEFSDSMRASFLSRDQPLICFSLAMASSMRGYISK
jgi:hypothetical protein